MLKSNYALVLTRNENTLQQRGKKDFASFPPLTSNMASTTTEYSSVLGIKPSMETGLDSPDHHND